MIKAKIIELKCSYCGINFNRSLRIHKKYKNRKNAFCSRTCSIKVTNNRDRTGINNPNYGNGYKILKENNPNWRGGSTYTIKQIRKSLDYQIWRETILKRDGYSCVICSSTEKLEVDHIKPLSKNFNLALNIDNGRTLCQKCHIKTDTYGAKVRKVS